MREILGGLTFLGLGSMAFYFGKDLSMGQLRLPGPGALPKIASGLVGLLALVLVVRGVWAGRRNSAPAADAVDPMGYVRIASAMGLIAAYAVVLPSAGFLLSTMVLSTALFMLGGSKPGVWVPLLLGTAMSLFSYFLFVWLLEVRMPGGSLWGR